MEDFQKNILTLIKTLGKLYEVHVVLSSGWVSSGYVITQNFLRVHDMNNMYFDFKLNTIYN